MPLDGPPAAASPYGAGACANISCQVSALAGNMTTISFGTTMTWPFTLMVPPQCALAVQAASSVASWMKPTVSNCVDDGDSGMGSCARSDPAASITSAAITAAVRNTIAVLNSLPIFMIGPGGALL